MHVQAFSTIVCQTVVAVVLHHQTWQMCKLPEDTGDVEFLFDDATQLGVQHSQSVTFSILFQEFPETYKTPPNSETARNAKQNVIAESHAFAVVSAQAVKEQTPLLSLLSTSAAAAARASVVFSNLLNALSLTTFLAPSGVLKSADRSCV